LDSLLEENHVKTLNDYKIWKESGPILRGAIQGIPTLTGYGCTDCNFSNERKREVTGYMKKTHSLDQETSPVSCSLQQVFSSQLRGFWRVDTVIFADEINDEGIMALGQFRAEFKKFEQEDSCSTVGDLYPVQYAKQDLRASPAF